MFMLYYWGLGVSEWFGPFTSEEDAKNAIEDSKPEGADFVTVVKVAETFTPIQL